MSYTALENVTKIRAEQRRYGSGPHVWEQTVIDVAERDPAGVMHESTVGIRFADPNLGALVAKAINAAVSEYRTSQEEKAA
ncbi:hypothetical protein [Alsobacter sp. R-9]